MIIADNIGFQRGNKTLFAPASFRFGRPEFVAVIGPNGAGKSTLLQLLSGFYVPTSGSVAIHGRPAAQWKPAELAFYRACLQQQQSVFGSFTVEDVLTMGRSIHFDSCPRSEDKALVTQTLQQLGLTERRAQPFTLLSGGEQQRVQFARTLLQLRGNTAETLAGKALFLDEPLNNLDLFYQYNLLEMARNGVVDRGGIVIAVLHDINMAYRFADRVIVLSGGNTIVDAPAEEALTAGLLSAVYQMNIEKTEPPNGLPYFAVTGVPYTGTQVGTETLAAGINN